MTKNGPSNEDSNMNGGRGLVFFQHRATVYGRTARRLHGIFGFTS